MDHLEVNFRRSVIVAELMTAWGRPQAVINFATINLVILSAIFAFFRKNDLSQTVATAQIAPKIC